MSDLSAFKYIHKLKGHRILVVGGSSGVGFCVAEAAVEHGAGAVIISSSRQKKLDNAVARLQVHAEKTDGSEATIVAKACDLSDPEKLDENVVQLLEFATEGGQKKLDHIVFSAGDLVNASKPLNELTFADMTTMDMVRNIGAITVAKHLANYVNQDARSSFTLTSGTLASRPEPGFAFLSGNITRTEGFTKSLALELKPVRVNCVQLGIVKTEIFDTFPKEQADHMMESMSKRCLTGKVGKPEEVAEAYVYCMKDTYVTAAIIGTNGGSILT